MSISKSCQAFAIAFSSFKQRNTKAMLSSILLPHRQSCPEFSRTVTFAILILSAVCLGAAPLIMPEGYSWIALSVSESAAQGLKGAWLARLGFILYGLAVIRIACSLRGIWPRGAYWAHMVFGVCMLGTAAFSHKPWLSDVTFDVTEDLLHSVTATGMGIGFTTGVIIRFMHRRQHHIPGLAVDSLAVIAAIVIPLAMPNAEGLTGILQRSMFGLGYIWYGRECRIPGASYCSAQMAS